MKIIKATLILPTMKSLVTYTSAHFCLILLFLLSVSTVPALSQAQLMTEEEKAAVRVEIEKLHKQEQKAFVEGDCDKVVSFFSDEATIYATGKKFESLQAFREFCSNVPRPFRGKGAPPKISDNFYVLSENAAHFVRTIDFDPVDDKSTAFKSEVVTKIWEKLNDEWKIVHFHSSVHSISDE